MINTHKDYAELAMEELTKQFPNIKYIKYQNARFGYSTEIPNILSSIQEPPNGDGLTLYSEDDDILLAIYGSNNMEQNFDAYIKSLIEFEKSSGYTKHVILKSPHMDKYDSAWIEFSNDNSDQKSVCIIEKNGVIYSIVSMLHEQKSMNKSYLELHQEVFINMIKTFKLE